MNNFTQDHINQLVETGKLELNTKDLQDYLIDESIQYDEGNESFFIADIGYSLIPDNFWINTEWYKEDQDWLLNHDDNEIFEFHFSFL